MPRLRPPPELPAIDLDLHRARIERRVRLAAAGEMVPRDRLAANFSKLPALGAAASPEQLADFVTTFFAELAAAPPQPIQAAEAAA
jgi:type IV secretion system protein VirD4